MTANPRTKIVTDYDVEKLADNYGRLHGCYFLPHQNACELCKREAADFLASLPDAPTPEPTHDTKNGIPPIKLGPWRRVMALRHGCNQSALYGDDGELQCKECGVDFARMEPNEIDSRWMMLGRKRLQSLLLRSITSSTLMNVATTTEAAPRGELPTRGAFLARVSELYTSYPDCLAAPFSNHIETAWRLAFCEVVAKCAALERDSREITEAEVERAT
jgi:hypothetical protein